MERTHLVVVARPLKELPNGVRRRAEHLLDHYSSEGRTKLLVMDGSRGRLGRAFGMLRTLTRLRLATRRRVEVHLVALFQPTMVAFAALCDAMGISVTVDACDSWRLLGDGVEGDEKLARIVRRGARLQAMLRRGVPVSYISRRDADSDRDLNAGRYVFVIAPSVARELRAMPKLSPGRIERVVVSGDYRSFHVREGMKTLAEAWPRHASSHSAARLDVYGVNMDELDLGPTAHKRGFAADVVELYAGATAVFVPNRRGSGIPNKLLEAVAAQRPIILDRSLADLLEPHPWVFPFADGPTLELALAGVHSLDVTDDTPPLRLRERRVLWADEAVRPQVLIRTFPPNTNPNYGGILQAWALQQVLDRMGVTAHVDSSSAEKGRQAFARFKSALRRVLVLAGPKRLLPGGLIQRELERTVNAPILRFAPERIRMTRLYTFRGRIDAAAVGLFSGYVVGSDQVWRPDYADVREYLLDFLPDGSVARRVAYAASFGSDAPAFTEELRASTRVLARRFDALSVREDSGQLLCDELWGVNAERVVDPTVLLDGAEYLRLAGPARDFTPGERLAVYVLDPAEEKQDVAARLAAELGLDRKELKPVSPGAYSVYRRDPSRYDRPSVEEWLEGLAGSRFVLTDSYHGCVFSILFHRPFLVIPNEKRGLARFASLLGLFGLENRVAVLSAELSDQMLAPIDWARVDSVIDAERARAYAYLRRALGPLVPVLENQG